MVLTNPNTIRFAAALLVLAAASLLAQEELISIEIHGVVTTDEDETLANSEIELSFTKFLVDESGVTQQSDERVAVTTDEQGRYSIKINIAQNWTNFELRLNPFRLDRVHYVQPRNRQLTELIKTGIESGTFDFEVNWLIESRTGWREIRRRINTYGENSAKGRLLRDYGLPEKEQEYRIEGRVVQIWFYYTQGFAVRFVDGAKDKEFRFRPRQPPS